MDGADFHSLAMVQRERVFRQERGATHGPLRVNDSRFALGFGSANPRKNRPDASGRYAHYVLLGCLSQCAFVNGPIA